MDNEKTCTKCLSVFPLSRFYRSKKHSSGYKSACKACEREAELIPARRQKILDAKKKYSHSEKGVAQRKKYFSDPERVTARREAGKRHRNSLRGRALKSAYLREYRRLFRERARARAKLDYAVKVGKVVPTPCWVCGEKAEAHHPDYSRPLDAVWLCPKHHREVHVGFTLGTLIRKPLTLRPFYQRLEES